MGALPIQIEAKRSLPDYLPARTVCVLVDHPRRQIVRQFPLAFDLDRQRAHEDTSDDDARRVDRRIGFAEGRDHAVAPPGGGTQVDE